MSKPRIIIWDEIAGAATTMFHIFTGKQELRWANKAWKCLTRRGLTKYTNEIERQLVLVRLMALATMYREFCALAWEEWQEPEYLDWTAQLDVNLFRIAQLAGPEFERDTDASPDHLLDEALETLIDEARNDIYVALRDEFGGGDSMLFASLWASTTGEDEEGEDDLDFILNKVTPYKMQAFMWIDEGMLKVH